MNINKEKLGLDVHGVLDSNPALFLYTAEMYDEVHIITGGSFDNKDYTLYEDLLKLGGGKKWWTHQFSIYDHLLKTKAKTNEELGIASTHPFPDETWNKVKAAYCLEHGIDWHVDDMEQYLIYFTTPCLLYKDPKRKHRGEK